MNKHVFFAQAGDSGVRIDKFLAHSLADQTRSFLVKLMEKGYVRVNGKQTDKSDKLQEGDRVEIEIPQPVALKIEAENIPLDIVYEDEALLVVNKPQGMVVHPAAGNFDKTLVNALLYHCKGSLSGINGVLRPGIVHRIDKDTSGLLVVAKNDAAHRGLAAQIKEHSFTREYQTVVHGNIRQDTATVTAPIGRHPVDRKKMAVTQKNAKQAVTHYTVLERYTGFTHLQVRLETGRTHQIRVHMAYIGHPVAGDPVYGPKKPANGLKGQCLHAWKIGFVHPLLETYMEFTSPLPVYFTQFLQRLAKDT
ncbi:MAG TPA: RluA family pseudouridine synthase [Candidatus Scatavimonas merdigallinarum]|uniref:Pseudouridine synthase n=1 Tax=Candidatus Scatavimonas merdigallinarum TaxID=2840914 RepID=A0A9D0ZGE0_9FIRM|nr:RluA family pseudouridine synthase [Candidatus Scatavimonas merdigallinarum]